MRQGVGPRPTEDRAHTDLPPALEARAAHLIYTKRLASFLGCTPFDLAERDADEVLQWAQLLRAQDDENGRRAELNSTRKPENQIPSIEL